MKVATKYVCEDTGSLLLDSQIKFSYLYGGERVIFDKEELQSIKILDTQGIKLMGFKPRSALKPYNIRTSDFIYPDDSVYFIIFFYFFYYFYYFYFF